MQKKGAALRAALADDVQDSFLAPGSSPGLRPAGEVEPASLAFTPVPRRFRHDGWTPERQRAFIHALADTGCVDRSARMVNIAHTNAYELRRAPGGANDQPWLAPADRRASDRIDGTGSTPVTAWA